jgi:hypothetical protein
MMEGVTICESVIVVLCSSNAAIATDALKGKGSELLALQGRLMWQERSDRKPVAMNG